MKLQESAACFPTGRIRFENPSGELGAPLQGQAFLYLGDDVDSFTRTFAAFGKCVVILQESRAA